VIRRLTGILLILLLPGCGIGSWLAGGESNIEPPAPLSEFAPTAAVVARWSGDFGPAGGKRFVKLAPLLRHGTVYVSDETGVVRAYEAGGGALLWEQRLNLPVSAGLGEGEGLLLAGTRKGQVLALEPDRGKLLWAGEVSSEVLAPPAAAAGVVVIQSVDGRLSGLSAASGKPLWSLERSEPPLSMRGTAAPVIVSGVVLAGFASGKLAAVHLSDGRMLWETVVAPARGRSEIERLVDVDSPPLIIGSVLYAAAYQGKIVAISLENGRVLWSRDISTYNEMDADRSNLYVSDERGHVLALDLQSGATVWKQDKLQARGLSAPTVVGGAVAVGDFQGYAHWLAASDGSFRARHQVSGGAVRAKPAADRQTLYVATQGGGLAALELRPH
jgi:outer membrane protein assembly factor BamB